MCFWKRLTDMYVWNHRMHIWPCIWHCAWRLSCPCSWLWSTERAEMVPDWKLRSWRISGCKASWRNITVSWWSSTICLPLTLPMALICAARGIRRPICKSIWRRIWVLMMFFFPVFSTGIFLAWGWSRRR